MRIIIVFGLIISPLLALLQGNCSSEDLQYIGTNMAFVQEVTADCGVSCLFTADPQTCFETCFSAQVPLTGPCVSCFSAQTDCASANCLFACAFGTEADCAACLEVNCLPDFNICAGIEDLDEDTYTTLSDCNDSDANIHPDAIEIWYDGVDQNCDGLNDFDQDGDGEMAFGYGGNDCDDTDASTTGVVSVYYMDSDGDGYGVLSEQVLGCSQPEGTSPSFGDCDDADSTRYPGAVGTGMNIDNNCNGIVEGDEVFACIGDFNNDSIVGTDDLLSFLSSFGCTAGCIIDLTGDDVVNSADLLIFLSVFGTTCL